MTETVHAAEIINAAAERRERALTKPNASRGRVIPDQTIWRQLARAQGGLNPTTVSRRLRCADDGTMWPLVDLANELRQKDGHLQGILEARETAVQRLGWDLELPKKPTKAEKKAAEFVRDAFSDTIAPLIAHCSSSPFYGYAVTETVWRKASGYLVPERFVPVHQRRFDRKSSSVTWDDHDGMVPVDVRAEFPGCFTVCQPRVNGDVPAREGLMRVLVWPALFRNWTLTDWLRLGEIAWKPWRTAQYKRELFANQEDIDDLVNTIDAMSTSGTAVLSDAVTLDVKWPTGQNGTATPHKDLFSTMAREMSKAVLGQTETTEASQSSGYAQGKIHYEVKKEKTDSDAHFIAHDITRDVIAWMIGLNFGDRVRPPMLRFITEETAELEAFGNGVKALKEAGLRMPAKWARDKAGIPAPADGEEVIGEMLPGDAEPDSGTAPTTDQEPDAGDHAPTE